jgi:hypothetical protein
LVDNIPAINALPAPKEFTDPVEFFVEHRAAASMTSHRSLLLEHFLAFFNTIFQETTAEVNRVKPVFCGGKYCIFGQK